MKGQTYTLVFKRLIKVPVSHTNITGLNFLLQLPDNADSRKKQGKYPVRKSLPPLTGDLGFVLCSQLQPWHSPGHDRHLGNAPVADIPLFVGLSSSVS